MTFTYLISVPLILSYSVGMAVVKYREGYMALIGYGSEFSCFDKGCGDIFLTTIRSYPYSPSILVTPKSGSYISYGNDTVCRMEPRDVSIFMFPPIVLTEPRDYSASPIWKVRCFVPNAPFIASLNVCCRTLLLALSHISYFEAFPMVQFHTIQNMGARFIMQRDWASPCYLLQAT